MIWKAVVLAALTNVFASLASAETLSDRLIEVDQAISHAEAALERGAAVPDSAPAREAQSALTAARAARESARLLLNKRGEIEETGRRAERELPRLQTELTRDPERAFSTWRSRIPDNSPTRALESLLAKETADLEAAGERLRASTNANATRDSWIADAERFAQLRLREEDLNRQLQAQSAADRSGVAESARYARALAELAAIEAELALLDEARQTASIRDSLAQVELALARAAATNAERKVSTLEQLIAQASAVELKRRRDEIEAQLAAIPEQDESLRRQAEINLQMAEELIERNQQLVAQRQRTLRVIEDRDQTAAALSTTAARLALAGGHEVIGQLLQAERRRLGKPSPLASRLSEVRDDLSAVRLRLLELSALNTVRSDQDDAADGSEEVVRSGDHAALAKRVQESRQLLIETLSERLRRLQLTLERAELALRRQLQDTLALSATLDRELIWIPSHSTLSKAWLAKQWEGWRDLLTLRRWALSVELLGERLYDRPWPFLAGALVVTALLGGRRRMRLRIEALTPPHRRVTQDRFLLTMQALGWTVLYAAPFPLALAVLGSQWQSAGVPGKFSHSLGAAISLVAASWFALEFLRALSIERGVAHVHFRWTRPRRESIAKAMPQAMAVLLPLQFIAGLAFFRGVDLSIDVCARTATALFACYAAWMAWTLLAPGALWSPRGRSEPHRWRKLFRAVLPALLLGLLGLLAFGYVYSAAVLLNALWHTFWTVVAVSVVHGLLARWFLLGERRLSHARLLAQREQEQAGERSESGEELPDTVEESLSIESVNAQTSRLLRATTFALWVIGLLWVWSDVVPALARLDEMQLWTVGDVDGEGQAVTVAISLKSLLFGLASLAFTWVAARNLPGLLEIGLLSRIRIDAPSRYAIASISRYLIVIVGSMVGLGLLGLRWSQLQWMAAALSVGLGFGLQEIFGNFVSGLILLFERPFRVGDIITIGDLSGTVTRIRTRATTLVDFDNKEIVVPNKTFITDRLINWTLSDTRTRIILPVGVAYGSEIALVHRLLRQAADEHEKVLKDPRPSSWLLAFGASSLDFELRVFVDTVSDRLPVTNDLNTRIAELFAEHKINIAFPQLDVHLRQYGGDGAANDGQINPSPA